MKSTQVENTTSIGVAVVVADQPRAHLVPAADGGPCRRTRVIVGRLNHTLPSEPVPMRSAIDGPPSSAKADGSSTP